MKRIRVLSLILPLVVLGGCVVTPAYRYSGGADGYYYGSPYYSGSTTVYGSVGPDIYGAPYYYSGYYDPWAPVIGTRVIYRSEHDRRWSRDHYGHDHYGHDRHARDHRQTRLGASGQRLLHHDRQPQRSRPHHQASRRHSWDNKRHH